MYKASPYSNASMTFLNYIIASTAAILPLRAATYFWDGSTFSDVSGAFVRVQHDAGTPGSGYSSLRPDGTLNVLSSNIDTSSLTGSVTDWAFRATDNGYLSTTAGTFFWDGSTFSDVSGAFVRVQHDAGTPGSGYSSLRPDGTLNVLSSNIDTSSLTGSVTDWAFRATDNGYLSTTAGTYFWDGSTFSDVSGAFVRVQHDAGTPGSGYSSLRPDGTLNVLFSNIDTSSLTGSVTDWAFRATDNGYLTVAVVPEPTMHFLLPLVASLLLLTQRYR